MATLREDIIIRIDVALSTNIWCLFRKIINKARRDAVNHPSEVERVKWRFHTLNLIRNSQSLTHRFTSSR